MMSDLDREITRAVREVVDAAPPARPFENLRDRPDRMGSLSPGWRRRGALVVACSALVVAGVVAMVVVGSESGNDAPTSGLPSTLPATVPAVAPPLVPSTADATVASTPMTGAATPVAIGASVMLGAAPELADRGFAVDAEESRQFAGVLDRVNALRASSRLGNVVVVDAGDNGTIQPDDLGRLMAALSDVERVVFVTSNGPHAWITPNNDLLRSLPTRYANVVVANWDVDAAHCPGECFYEDGFHLRPDGGAHYAQVLTDAAKIDGFGDIPVLQACPPTARVEWREATSPRLSGPVRPEDLTVRTITTTAGGIALIVRSADGSTVRASCQTEDTYQLSLEQGLGIFDVGQTDSGVVLAIAYPSEFNSIDKTGLGQPSSTFVGNGLTAATYLIPDDLATDDLPFEIGRAIETARTGTLSAGGIDLTQG